MTVSIEVVLKLLGETLSDSSESAQKRFRDFIEMEITEVEELKQYIDECLEKGGRGGRGFNNALQDIIVSIGKRLGFEVKYGQYSGVRGRPEIAYDGLWIKQSGEHILVEVKSSPWPVGSITEQLGQYMEDYAQSNNIPPTQVFGIYAVGPGDHTAIANQIKGSDYRNRIRLVSFDDLLKLVELTSELDSIGGPGSGAPKVQSILLPFDSVNVGDFINTITEIAELRSTAVEVGEEVEEQPPEEKVWERETLTRYLEDSTPNQRAFLTVLSEANEDEEPLPKKLVLQRMKRVATLIPEIPSDQKFTGYTIAGLRAGFKMRRNKFGTEDIISEEHHQYRLKAEYKNIVKEWVRQKGLTVPPPSEE